MRGRVTTPGFEAIGIESRGVKTGLVCTRAGVPELSVGRSCGSGRNWRHLCGVVAISGFADRFSVECDGFGGQFPMVLEMGMDAERHLMQVLETGRKFPTTRSPPVITGIKIGGPLSRPALRGYVVRLLRGSGGCG